MPHPTNTWTVPTGLSDAEVWELAEHHRLRAEACRSTAQKGARYHWTRHRAAVAELEARGARLDEFAKRDEREESDPRVEATRSEEPARERLGRRGLKYIELKTGFNDNGPAWIGYVQESKSGRTLYFHGKRLQRIPGGGAGSNHYDLETGEEYWVSGVKKNGEDRHWAGSGPVEVAPDAAEEYERIRREAGSRRPTPR